MSFSTTAKVGRGVISVKISGPTPQQRYDAGVQRRRDLEAAEARKASAQRMRDKMIAQGLITPAR